jgi:hypothetical protein
MVFRRVSGGSHGAPAAIPGRWVIVALHDQRGFASAKVEKEEKSGGW